MRRERGRRLILVLAGTLCLYGGSEGDGSYNVFYGNEAGINLSGGTSNTFIGRWAGNKNEDGNKSVFIGTSSGYGNVHGSYNTFVGEDSGYHNQSGENTFIGYESGHENTRGFRNIFVGAWSGQSNTTGILNTFVGAWSGQSNTTGDENTFVGEESGCLNTRGGGNTFVGSRSGEFNSDGFYNTFVGWGSGDANTHGSFNTFLGEHSGYFNRTGDHNTFIGGDAGYHAANINNSLFLGYKAGYHATRSNTLYIANDNTNTPLIYGEFDTRLVKIHGDLNTTGAVSAAFHGATEKQALKMMDISVYNTDTNKKSDVGFLMTNAREGFGWTFRTWEPDQGFAIAKYGNGGTKELRLYDATPDDPTTVVLRLANGAWCDGVWHDASSRSLKTDIRPLDGAKALEVFEKLRPVTYAYKAHPGDQKVGFIAEEVPELVADPSRKSLSAMDMVALLTKVVQEKDREIREVEKMLKAKDRQIQSVRQSLKSLESRLSGLEVSLERRSAP